LKAELRNSTPFRRLISGQSNARNYMAPQEELAPQVMEGNAPAEMPAQILPENRPLSKGSLDKFITASTPELAPGQPEPVEQQTPLAQRLSSMRRQYADRNMQSPVRGRVVNGTV